MQKYIPELMNMYTDMLKQNTLSKNKYDADVKKHTAEKYWHPDYSTKPFSDTMLHSVITIINRLNIGQSVTNSGHLNGTIKSISYYPQKLSSDVLKGLTA